MKIGIVVPFFWSFRGAVLEHAELQANALERRGVQPSPTSPGEPLHLLSSCKTSDISKRVAVAFWWNCDTGQPRGDRRE